MGPAMAAVSDAAHISPCIVSGLSSVSGNSLRGGENGAEFDANINSRAEAVDDGEQAVEGEAAQVGIADAGEVGGSDSCLSMGCSDAEALTVEHLDNLRGEDSLQLLHIRAGMSQVAEDIAAATDDFNWFSLHIYIVVISDNIRSGLWYPTLFTKYMKRMGHPSYVVSLRAGHPS